MTLSYVTVQLHVNHREGMASEVIMANTLGELNRGLGSLRGQGDVIISYPTLTDAQSVKRITPEDR